MHLKTQKHNCMTIKNIFGSVMQFTPQKCLKQNEDKSVRKHQLNFFTCTQRHSILVDRQKSWDLRKAKSFFQSSARTITKTSQKKNLTELYGSIEFPENPYAS